MIKCKLRFLGLFLMNNLFIGPTDWALIWMSMSYAGPFHITCSNRIIFHRMSQEGGTLWQGKLLLVSLEVFHYIPFLHSLEKWMSETIYMFCFSLTFNLSFSLIFCSRTHSYSFSHAFSAIHCGRHCSGTLMYVFYTFKASFVEPIVPIEDAYINGILRQHCPRVQLIEGAERLEDIFQIQCTSNCDSTQ